MKQRITFLLICNFVLIGSLAAAPQYEITDLGTLGCWDSPPHPSCDDHVNQQSRAYGINDNGDIVGFSDNYGVDNNPVIWRDGQITTLDLPRAQSSRTSYFDINNNGQILYKEGIIGGGILHNQYYLTRPGLPFEQASILDNDIYCDDMNNNGTILGRQKDNGQSFTWQNGQYNWLDGVSASAINDSGKILSTANNQIILHDSNGENVQIIDSIPADVMDTILKLNNNGDVLASFQYHDIISHKYTYETFIYNADGTISTVSLDDEYGPFNFNDTGQVLAHSEEGFYLWQDSQTDLLSDLIIDSTGWEISTITDMNNNGQMVGFGSHDGIQRAFLLNPVPEPATLGLLLIGTSLALRRRQLKK